MKDAFIKGLERAIARNKDKQQCSQNANYGFPSANRSKANDIDADLNEQTCRATVITRTTQCIHKRKETTND